VADNELDVRRLRKPDKHPTIFATYAALAAGESFVVRRQALPLEPTKSAVRQAV
jgi:uncharacterized protein (DUF2249 family)